MTINFPKQYNSPEDLAELLSQRGLVFEDKERVCRYIRNIGYYRLSAYFYPFLEIPKDRQISTRYFIDVYQLFCYNKTDFVYTW